MVSKWHLIDEDIKEIKRVQKLDATTLTIKCCVCSLIKMSHHFFRDKSRKNGRSVRCIECERIKNNRRTPQFVLMADF